MLFQEIPVVTADQAEPAAATDQVEPEPPTTAENARYRQENQQLQDESGHHRDRTCSRLIQAQEATKPGPAGGERRNSL